MKIIKKWQLVLIIVCVSITAVLFTLFLLREYGLNITKAVPQYKPIASIDTSRQDANLDIDFVYPEEFLGFTLVFEDDSGDTRDFYSNPNWPLIIEIEIVDKRNNQQVIKATLDKTKMEFTNWHTPSTSLFLELDRKLISNLCFGEEYQLLFKVLQPNIEVGTCTIFIHWFEAVKIMNLKKVKKMP